MATRRVEIGPTGETVRTNVAKFRRQKSLTLRDVSTRLNQAGRPMAHNTVSEIERGARRIDVDDLVALAAVLEVLPVDLLGTTDAMAVIPSFVLDQLSRIIDDARAIG